MRPFKPLELLFAGLKIFAGLNLQLYEALSYLCSVCGLKVLELLIDSQSVMLVFKPSLVSVLTYAEVCRRMPTHADVS
jgi:hypothetical protein